MRPLTTEPDHYVDVIGVFYRRFAILGMNARRSGKLSTCLSDPEVIHAGKNKRVLGLKNVPKIESDHGPVEGKSLSEMLEDMTSEFEAEKFQLVLTQKGFDFGKRQLMFLNVKQ